MNGQTITIEAGNTTGTVVFETPANDVYPMWELACLRWRRVSRYVGIGIGISVGIEPLARWFSKLRLTVLVDLA
ncbi:hypothetical protein [Pseudomonas tolaasii]|uniref:hypothetical protein n=1 Tax=Pseudomonas tolaasii TaxID=29442 RepID=UPI0012DB3F84|nr:hypothetical protein [Pseudomonas tolaasii]